MKKEMNALEMLKIGGILFLITSVVALLLGGVNALTKDKIVQINIEKTQNAMSSIIPEAEFAEETVAEGADGTISKVYKATKGGEDVGYCLEVKPIGFGDAITMIVGINTDGTVAGIDITKHAETPGLGALAADDSFKSQYPGKAADGSIAVIKNGTPAENEIVALSGATITSQAVTNGVNAAAQYVANLK